MGFLPIDYEGGLRLDDFSARFLNLRPVVARRLLAALEIFDLPASHPRETGEKGSMDRLPSMHCREVRILAQYASGSPILLTRA
jgi:hypothetical protein